MRIYLNKFLSSGAAHLTEQILNGKIAAITICTAPLNVTETTFRGSKIDFDHVALVFELNLHPENGKNNIDLFLVQFGEGSRPLIEGRKETLIKVHGGQQISEFSQEAHDVKPIYSRKLTIFADRKKATSALVKAENDENLVYNFTGGSVSFPNTYNCCTYASMLLEAALDAQEMAFKKWVGDSWIRFKRAEDLLFFYKVNSKEYSPFRGESYNYHFLDHEDSKANIR